MSKNSAAARAATRAMAGGGDDERPAVAIGHVSLRVDGVARAAAFFAACGMRPVLERGDFAILELRGGTHLVLREAEEPIEPGSVAPFDLMADDIDAMHARLVSGGIAAGAIERGRIHDSFTAEAPGGYAVRFNSSHVVGPV